MLAQPRHPSPIAADELARARTPILENIANSVKNNTAWLGIVDAAQSKPAKLDRFRSGGTAFGKVSADDLLVLARTYLAPETCPAGAGSVRWRRQPGPRSPHAQRLVTTNAVASLSVWPRASCARPIAADDAEDERHEQRQLDMTFRVAPPQHLVAEAEQSNEHCECTGQP